MNSCLPGNRQPGLIPIFLLILFVCIDFIFPYSSSSAGKSSILQSSSGELSESAPFILTDRLRKEPLTHFIQFYADISGKSDIRDISSDKFDLYFAPVGRRTGFGYSSSTFWFRLKVNNTTANEVKWFIEYSYPAVDKFTFYIPEERKISDLYLDSDSTLTKKNEYGPIGTSQPVKADDVNKKHDGGFTVIESGDSYPFSRRPVNFRTTIIPISQPPGEDTYYFKIRSEGAILLPLTAWGESIIHRHMNVDTAINWLYYGMMFAAVVLNFFIYISVRERIYLYLILFVSGISMLEMAQDGLSFQYLWPDSIWWANVSNPFFGISGFLGAILFTSSFLQISTMLPRMYRFLKLMALAGLALLFVPFIFPYHIATQTMVIFAGVSGFTLLACVIILSAKGQRQGRIYMVALSGILVSTLFTALNLFGIIENNILAGSRIPQVSMVMLVFILSFGLVDKINILQKEKEHALNNLFSSESRYRMLADNVKEVIWTLDLKSLKLNYVTPSVFAMTGYSSEEAINNFSFRKMLSPESAKRAIKAIKDGIRSDREENPIDQIQMLEIEFLRKDGGTIWVDTNITFVRDDSGLSMEMLGVSRDITERILSEKERKKLEKQLIQSNKLEAIGTLAGGISHDMNNILTAIMGYVEISLSDVSGESRIYRRLERVLSACHRAKDLVKQILTFSRRDCIDNIAVDLNIMVKEVIKLIRASLPPSTVIKQDISRDQFIIVADPTKIHQIIMNLCSNANYAMRDRDGVMGISTGIVEIDNDKDNPELSSGRYVRLTVSDNGHGMEADVIEHIFEPFFTTKSLGEGTGMGLSMVHGIVKNLGGDIRVYSEVGKGTTFNLFFPEAAYDEIPDRTDKEAPVRGQGAILYVDDESSIVNMASEMLSSLGYSVTGVTESVRALEIFRKDPSGFDIVVTDHNMPVMTGKKLASEIVKLRRDIPIIICSGLNDFSDSESFEQYGISAYIMKPFSRKELASKIGKALSEKCAESPVE